MSGPLLNERLNVLKKHADGNRVPTRARLAELWCVSIPGVDYILRDLLKRGFLERKAKGYLVIAERY